MRTDSRTCASWTRAGALVLLLLAGLGALPAAAQETDPPDDASAASPGVPELRWDATLGRVLLAAHMSALDTRLDAVVGRVASASLDPLAEAGDWFGTWRSSLPYLAAGAAAVGGLTEGGRGLTKSGAVLAGVLAGSVVNEGLNQAVGRERPTRRVGAYTFRPFNGHASFPSGHAAYAFSIAGGIDAVTDGWVPATAAYGAATLTALSRIYHEKHWFSDVAVGAFIGAAVSRHAARSFLHLVGQESGDGGTGDGGPAPEAGRARGAGDGVGVGEGTAAGPGRGGGADADGPRLRLLASPGGVGVSLRF